jgi:glycosyltransferase involved in cell wall biosynthesis
MVAGLCERGWQVTVREIDASFPQPTRAALEQAARALSAIESHTTVLIDGLAFGAMPEVVEREAGRLRLIAVVHHPLAEETGIDRQTAARFRVSEQRALAAACLVIVTSRATAAMLAGYGVSADRIAIVEPGTDRCPLGVGSGGRVRRLLCVATVIPRKRHDVLVRALASIADRAWSLTCIGSLDRHPPTVDGLRVQLRAAGLETHVSLVGEVDAATLADYYHHADLFVLASEYEGYGMAVAEALAHGLPVVATQTGAVPDLVLGAVSASPMRAADSRCMTALTAAGILVSPGDKDALASAIEHLLSDSSERARFAEGARARRDRLRGWDVAAGQLADVLHQTATNGRLQR